MRQITYTPCWANKTFLLIQLEPSPLRAPLLRSLSYKSALCFPGMKILTALAIKRTQRRAYSISISHPKAQPTSSFRVDAEFRFFEDIEPFLRLSSYHPVRNDHHHSSV